MDGCADGGVCISLALLQPTKGGPAGEACMVNGGGKEDGELLLVGHCQPVNVKPRAAAAGGTAGWKRGRACVSVSLCEIEAGAHWHPWAGGV